MSVSVVARGSLTAIAPILNNKHERETPIRYLMQDGRLLDIS